MVLNQAVEKKFNLKYLAIYRPVIREVLGVNLSPLMDNKETDDMRWNLYALVEEYQEGTKNDDYTLNRKEFDLIMIQCCRLLCWIHRHPTHVWKDPTIRLLAVLLDNYSVPPEDYDYKEESEKWSLLGHLRRTH